jgi:hemolysin D
MQPGKPSLPAVRRKPDRQQPVRRRARQPITDLTELPKPVEGRVVDDRDFLPPALEVMETPVPPKVTLGVYLLCGSLFAAIAASILFSVATYAVAPGKVVAVGQTNVVQAVESGQISAIKAHDGDKVKQGDVVVELNPTDAVASRTIIANNIISERAEIARFRAENTAARAEPVVTEPSLSWDADVPQSVRDREESVFRSDTSQLSATIAQLTAQRNREEKARDGYSAGMTSEKSLIAATTEQVGIHQQLETKGWDSHARVLEALEPLKEQQAALTDLASKYNDSVAAIPVIDSQIATARETFVTSNMNAIANAERQIENFAQQLTKADQTVDDMTLKSPVSGTVHAVQATSIGQYVKPGQLLMSVVPDGAQLEVMAYVLNIDIGYVREGQKVAIKVDTFYFTRYGTIEGTVRKVASDAISGSEALVQQKNASQPSSGANSATGAAQQTGDLVFPVEIALSKQSINVEGKEQPLSPGMSVVAEITTGDHRIISYIMYPLVRGAPETMPKPAP